MIYISIDNDGSYSCDPMIAKVSNRGVMETMWFSYADQKGTLKQLVWTDDFGEVRTALLKSDNTITINTGVMSELKARLQIISPLSGVVLFQSKEFKIALAVPSRPKPDRPPSSCCGKDPTYRLLGRLREDLDVEIKTRQSEDDSTLAKANEYANKIKDALKDAINDLKDKTNTSSKDISDKIDKIVESLSELKKSHDELSTNYTSHANNEENPHKVTKAQVGLSNVDNTADVDKPISKLVQNAIDKIQASIDKLIHHHDADVPFGYASITPLVNGITSEVEFTILNDVTFNEDLRYAILRDIDGVTTNVIEIDRKAEDRGKPITSTMATVLIEADDNKLARYRKSQSGEWVIDATYDLAVDTKNRMISLVKPFDNN